MRIVIHRALPLMLLGTLLPACPQETPVAADVTVAAASSACREATPRKAAQEAVVLSNDGDKMLKADPAAAVAQYEKAIALDPTNHRIVFKLAMAHRKMENWEAAAAALATATKLAPTFANYWFERGYALEQQAKKKSVPWDEVRDAYSRCVEADRGYAACHGQLGEVYQFLGDDQKALDSYTQAIERAPTSIPSYAALADLYVRLGFAKEAEQVLEQAKKLAKPGDPTMLPVHLLFAQIYRERGELARVIAELEAAKSMSSDGPNAVLVIFNLGVAYAQLSPPRKTEATELLKGFMARVCKGPQARKFQAECETASDLLRRLGGGTP